MPEKMVPDRERPVTIEARKRVPTTSRTTRVSTTAAMVPRLTLSSVRGRTSWGMGNAAQQARIRFSIKYFPVVIEIEEKKVG